MEYPIPKNPDEIQKKVIKLLGLHPKTISIHFEVQPDDTVLMVTTAVLTEKDLDKVLTVLEKRKDGKL